MVRVKDLIENKEKHIIHKNCLLVGENATAKTYILEKWLNEDKESKWYINVYNKTIDFEGRKLNPKETIKINIENILFERSDEDKIDDEFDSNLKTQKGRLFFGYFTYNQCMSVVKDFFKKEIELNRKGELFLGGVEQKKLSSGIQAIIRILSEIELAVALKRKHIYIDELCKNLDNKNAYDLIKFITLKYKNVNFYITTHSSDVILGANDFTIFKINSDSLNLNDKSIEIKDSNEFNSDVSTKKYFYSTFDSSLRKKYNEIYSDYIINGIIDDYEIKELNRIKDKNKLQEIKLDYDIAYLLNLKRR